ncbi:MAG: hypothetical protein JW768_00595 [Chitinispirillaceae bacterium]|nr:hypothetical protein [Chitinispirillaceae bacterium]
MYESCRRGSSQLISLVSDMISENEIDVVVADVHTALMTGVRKILVRITVGALSNQRRISVMLMHCMRELHNKEVQFLLIEKNSDPTPAYGGLCRLMHIPYYKIKNKPEQSSVETKVPTGPGTIS